MCFKRHILVSNTARRRLFDFQHALTRGEESDSSFHGFTADMDIAFKAIAAQTFHYSIAPAFSTGRLWDLNFHKHMRFARTYLVRIDIGGASSIQYICRLSSLTFVGLVYFRDFMQFI